VRELDLGDWWRVLRRELLTGTLLGLVLGCIGLLRVMLQPGLGDLGADHMYLAFTVAGSLVGVVLFGSLVGSMLPFLLRRVGLDPATASTPAIATLCDVAGTVIYLDVERVDHPVAVDPDATLRAKAQERGWEVISLR
jgi:magnesium transporter